MTLPATAREASTDGLGPATRLAASFSVCVVSAGRDELTGLLGSIDRAAAGHAIEVLVAANADPLVRARAQGLDTSVEVTDFTNRVPLGVARNAIADRARGEWLVFLDDDTEVPAGFFNSLASLIETWPMVAVFGGPNVNPEGSPPIETAQGLVLGSPLAAGPFAGRYRLEQARTSAVSRALTLCNLAVRRDAFIRFHTALDRSGEETWLLRRLDQTGVVARADPRLAVAHRRRPDLISFFRQASKYGHGRIAAEVLSGHQMAVIFTATVLAVAGTLTALVAPILLLPTLGACYLGSAAVSAASLALTGRHRGCRAGHIFGAIVALQAGYLTGLVAGSLTAARQLARRRDRATLERTARVDGQA